jgi:two-component system chemotaxis sensor kinase CheA
LGEILITSEQCKAGDVQAAVQLQEAGDPRPLGEILVDNRAVAPAGVADALKAQIEHHDLSSNTIRVDVGLLDKVMNLVGELVLARNQVLQFTGTQEDSSFLSTAQRLNLITTELQEGVMKTRMQPIGNVWNKLPRIVRDLSVGCGKRVEVQMEGAETELDKTIIEAIKDPLTHIIRNAVDHGIETPEVRVARGKSPDGRLMLRAFHEGGQVNIEISDDGDGIATEKLKAKAIAKGMITAEHGARMSEREVLNLVFAAGLSTVEQVSNISGRGVGMDVVKTNIEKIGGTVDVQSTSGKGTLLKIKIPLTLAIIPALVVSSGGERFAIPQVSLVELVRCEGEQAGHSIEDIQGASVYRLRGNLLPLVYLNRELQISPAQGAAQSVNIVVLQAGDRQLGLVVDDINDTEEIVVKPLSKQLKSVPCFAGATIMGDGRVALILDVLGLAQMAKVVSELREKSLADHGAKSTDNPDARESWLLFRIGTEGRMAIPLSLVSRLEEFPVSQVERSTGREVIQYREQIMPLVRLAQAFGHAAIADSELLQVIVYSSHGRSVGLIVNEILDIVDQRVAVQHIQDAGALQGTAVIQQHVTDLLDVPALLAQQHLSSERAVA